MGLCAQLVGLCAQLVRDGDAARAEAADAWCWGYEAAQAEHAGPVPPDRALRLCHSCARGLGDL